MWNGFKREESSHKLYAMNDFIAMMINGMNLDLAQKMELALYWHQSKKPDRVIQTSNRWTFILLGRTEESFLNVLKMKSVLINFYIRYEKGSLQDEEGTMETLKGYILFERCDRKHRSLISCNKER